MRARNIKPGTFKNEILGTADPFLTLLFEGLWCLADREGRLEDRPLRIKAEIFPYRDLNVDDLLATLAKLDFITRYAVGGNNYLQINKFKEHQNPHHTERKSSVPAPVSSPLSSREYPADSLIPDSLIPDSPKEHAPMAPVVAMPKSTEKPKVTFVAVEPRAVTFELPPWIHEETWMAYEQMRVKKRAPMTIRARELVVAKLRDLMNKGHPPQDVLEQSIRSNWTDVYELKGNRNGGNHEPSKASRRQERNREVIQALARDIYGDRDLGNDDQQPQADGTTRQGHDAADVAGPIEVLPPVRH